MVIDDVHKIEFVIGGVAFVLLTLWAIGWDIYFKIVQRKMKKDREKKEEENKDDHV